MPTKTRVASIGYDVAPVADGVARPMPISLKAVNGWRGISALAIAFWHFWLVTGFVVLSDLRPVALLVDLFFVLSGLLIARGYLERLRSPSAIPGYIVRRFGRIWPVHAAMLALLVGYETMKLALQARFGVHFSERPFDPQGPNSIPAIWTNLLLVHSLGLHQSETWNFPSWSLSVEFVTYALFAAFCLLAPLIRRAASVAVIALSLAILVQAAPGHMLSTYDYGIFRCTAGFFAGSLLYDLLKTARLPCWSLPTVVECLGFLLVIVWLAYGTDTWVSFAAPIVFCVFILAFVQGRGAWSRMLSTRPFQFIADLSFSIYMVHAVVLILLLFALHAVERLSGQSLFVSFADPYKIRDAADTVRLFAPRSNAALLAVAVLYMGVVVFASYGVYRFIELPGRQVFNSIAERWWSRSVARRSKAARPPAGGMEPRR